MQTVAEKGKIERLTPAEEQRMLEFRERYYQIGLSTHQEGNFEQAAELIGQLYERDGRKRPRFIRAASPLEAQWIINVLQKAGEMREALAQKHERALDDSLRQAIQRHVLAQVVDVFHRHWPTVETHIQVGDDMHTHDWQTPPLQAFMRRLEDALYKRLPYDTWFGVILALEMTLRSDMNEYANAFNAALRLDITPAADDLGETLAHLPVWGQATQALQKRIGEDLWRQIVSDLDSEAPTSAYPMRGLIDETTQTAFKDSQALRNDLVGPLIARLLDRVNAHLTEPLNDAFMAAADLRANIQDALAPSVRALAMALREAVNEENPAGMTAIWLDGPEEESPRTRLDNVLRHHRVQATSAAIDERLLAALRDSLYRTLNENVHWAVGDNLEKDMAASEAIPLRLPDVDEAMIAALGSILYSQLRDELWFPLLDHFIEADTEVKGDLRQILKTMPGDDESQLNDALRENTGRAIWTKLFLEGLGLSPMLDIGDTLEHGLDDALAEQLDKDHEQLRNQLRTTLVRALSDDPAAFSQLWADLAGHLMLSEFGIIHDQITDALAEVIETLFSDMTYVSTPFWGPYEAYWVALYMFAETLREDMFAPQDSELLHVWDQLIRVAGLWYPFEDVCIISDLPLYYNTDERKRLHALSMPAVHFADGYNLYSVNGVRVPARLIEDPDSIHAQDILDERNVEARRIMMQIVGYARFIKETEAECTDKDDYGELYILPRPNDVPMHIVRYWCPSTGREYTKRVPRTCTTALGALAWAHYMTEEEYVNAQHA